MRKKLKIHDKPFESIEEAKSFFLENISKGDEIKKEVAETNCFWCVFLTEKVDRQFSVEKAIRWKANQ